MREIIDRKVIASARKRYADRNANRQKRLQEAWRVRDTAALNNADEMARFVNRFVQMGHPEIAAEVLEGMTSGTLQVSALERIIDQNELMGVSFFEGGRNAARAVGRIVVRDAAGRIKGYGTGFMISSQLLMTNNHVLGNAGVSSYASVEFDYALDSNGQTMTPRRFQLDPALFFVTNAPLDFTIVGVEEENQEGDKVSDRGWLHLIANSGKAIAGEPINIIQHPGGERQQIAIRENKVVGPDGDFLIYTTDTKRGSSGSPCCNDQWQLAALHHAGVPDEDASGNWLLMDGSIYRPGIDDPESVNWVANEGVRISRIVSHLNSLNLSSDQGSLLDEAFEPAPERPGSTNNRTANGGTGGRPGSGPNIGPDGIARWDFQLAFGPLGQMPTNGSDSRTSNLTRAAQPTSTPGMPGPQTNDIESVFSPLGEYLDESEEADAIEDYYAGIPTGLTKAKRFETLHELVKATHTNVLSYRSARHDHLYPWIDRHEDEFLKSIYSGDVMAEELFVSELKAFELARLRHAELLEKTSLELTEEELDTIDATLEQSSVFNCEHVVPQSWFKGDVDQRAQKSDMHHLFTCESGCNSFRSNIPYSDFTEDEADAIRAAEVSILESLEDLSLEAARPQCGLRDGRRFEPDFGKGAVARATLYFVLRYPGVVGDVKSGSKKEMVKSNVGILTGWASAEEPSRYERHRNAEIARVQGNRNPLIDHPEWIDKIAFENGFG
ncbi:MAG: endonuclease [Pseudomonadota bacterium]